MESFGIIVAVLATIPVIIGLVDRIGWFSSIRNAISQHTKNSLALNQNQLASIQYKEYLLHTIVYTGISPWIYEFGVCFFPSGALEDLFRLVANHHALFSMILADDEHPNSRIKRRFLFFATSCFSYCLSAFFAPINGIASVLVSLFIISPIQLVINKLFFTLAVCPCNAFIENENSCVIIAVKNAGLFFAIIGTIVGVAFIYFALLGLNINYENPSKQGLIILRSFIIDVLVVSSVQDLLLQLRYFVKPPSCLPKTLCGIHLIGRWYYERTESTIGLEKNLPLKAQSEHYPITTKQEDTHTDIESSEGGRCSDGSLPSIELCYPTPTA
eukprot:gene8672-11715_t